MLLRGLTLYFTLSLAYPHEFSGFKLDIKARGYPNDFDELSALPKVEEINISINDVHVTAHDSADLIA